MELFGVQEEGIEKRADVASDNARESQECLHASTDVQVQTANWQDFIETLAQVFTRGITASSDFYAVPVWLQ